MRVASRDLLAGPRSGAVGADESGMASSTHPRKTYDHRLRELVHRTGDLTIATRIGVPRSTAAGWIVHAPQEVVSLDVPTLSHLELEREVIKLRRRTERLGAVVRLLLVLIRVLGCRMSETRIPDEKAKTRLLDAVERAGSSLPSRAALRVLGISPARYHAWRRAEADCRLADRSSCPRTSPTQLTAEEVATVREMALSPDYRHIPTGPLAVLAQRLGKVFVSPTTWYRLVRDRGWRRPRRRIHPEQPKIGLRAKRPNEAWHIDTTVIRLLDGTRVYLHGVSDNFSRRILAFRLAERFEIGNTVAILLDAANAASSDEGPPNVIADRGVENVNGQVDELIESGLLRRVLAFTEIKFSNSMIEAWWRQLKYQHLFIHSLDSFETVCRLVKFYVEAHNSEIPHSAFRGQTPDEIYFGTGAEVPGQLQAAREEARLARMTANRALSCEVCVDPVLQPG